VRFTFPRFFESGNTLPGGRQRRHDVAERLDDIAALAVFLAPDGAASCTGADGVVDSGQYGGNGREGGAGGARGRLSTRRAVRASSSEGGAALLAHMLVYGQYGSVKTTLEIQDALLERAKRHAKRVRRPLRAIVEEGLRRVLADSSGGQGYVLRDASVGDPNGPDPLESLSWQDLRDEIYGEPKPR
jgi:hypothetical protein